MYLSYSGFTSHEKCPLQYFHRYIAKTTPPKPENRVNMLYGSIVGALFEQFYNEKMWRIPNFVGELISRIPGITGKIMADEQKFGVIKWKGTGEDKDPKANYKSLEDIFVDVRDTIPRGIAAIKYHRLVGKVTRAEHKLDSTIEGHLFGGRCDFIIHRIQPHNDEVIIDGKGSKFRGDYADPRQLRWYALQYTVQFGKLPDKVGFLYWRSDPETSMDWYTATADDVTMLRTAVLTTISQIEDGKRRLPVAPTKKDLASLFPAHPNSRDCGWCNYLAVCEEGTAFIAKRPAPIPSEPGVEDVGI